jgi:hypothetical protein
MPVVIGPTDRPRLTPTKAWHQLGRTITHRIPLNLRSAQRSARGMKSLRRGIKK